MRSRTSTSIRTPLIAATLALAVLGGVAVNTVTAVAATAAPRSVESAVVVAPAREVDAQAAFYSTLARAVTQSAAGKVDTSLLEKQLGNLDMSPNLPESSVSALTRLVRTSAADAVQRAAEHDAQIAEAARAQAAADAAAAEALAAANTPDGARATARAMAAGTYGWGDEQFSCLDSLWQKESNWNYQAYNDNGGATGIPQSLPGDKMAAFGADWQTNAATQIAWGLDYISRAYGTPCSAWGHSQSLNWY